MAPDGLLTGSSETLTFLVFLSFLSFLGSDSFDSYLLSEFPTNLSFQKVPKEAIIPAKRLTGVWPYYKYS